MSKYNLVDCNGFGHQCKSFLIHGLFIAGSGRKSNELLVLLQRGIQHQTDLSTTLVTVAGCWLKGFKMGLRNSQHAAPYPAPSPALLCEADHLGLQTNSQGPKSQLLRRINQHSSRECLLTTVRSKATETWGPWPQGHCPYSHRILTPQTLSTAKLTLKTDETAKSNSEHQRSYPLYLVSKFTDNFPNASYLQAQAEPGEAGTTGVVPRPPLPPAEFPLLQIKQMNSLSNVVGGNTRKRGVLIMNHFHVTLH